jgi:hypothetical protein
MPNEKPGSSPQNPVSVDQLLREANVPTVKTAPPATPDKPSAPIPQGAMFRDKSGKMMYRYELDGKVIVLPKPYEQMSEQDYYNLPVTLYDQLPGRIPQNLTVTFKDPQWGGHWFNKSAKDARRIAEARSLGFVPAKLSDLQNYHIELTDQDGAVEQGDLVLMKCHKALLYLRYKESMDKAKRSGGVEHFKSEANTKLSPANIDKDPYYVAEQAKQEFQGVGPVFTAGDGGVLNPSQGR